MTTRSTALAAAALVALAPVSEAAADDGDDRRWALFLFGGGLAADATWGALGGVAFHADRGQRACDAGDPTLSCEGETASLELAAGFAIGLGVTAAVLLAIGLLSSGGSGGLIMDACGARGGPRWGTGCVVRF